MSKIKFIEAGFHNADKDRRAIRERLERFLKTRRALERGIVPPDQGDRDDRLRWENELMQVGLGREGQDRVDRRVSRLAERRAAAQIASQVATGLHMQSRFDQVSLQDLSVNLR